MKRELTYFHRLPKKALQGQFKATSIFGTDALAKSSLGAGMLRFGWGKC